MTTQTHTLILTQKSTVPMSIILPMYRTLARQLGDSTSQDVNLIISIAHEDCTIRIDMVYNPVRGFTKEELTVNK